MAVIAFIALGAKSREVHGTHNLAHMTVGAIRALGTKALFILQTLGDFLLWINMQVQALRCLRAIAILRVEQALGHFS